MTPVPDNTSICGLSEPLFARRWPGTAGLGTLLSGQATISRAASSAVKRRISESTCSVYRQSWGDRHRGLADAFDLREDRADTMGTRFDVSSGLKSGSPSRRDVTCRRPLAP